MRVSLPLLNYLPGVYQGGAGGPQARRVTFGLNLAWSPLTMYRDPAFSAPLSRQQFGESWLQTDTPRTLDNVGNRSERGVLKRGRVKRIWPSSTMAPALLCRRGNNWGKVEDTDTACGTQLAWTHRHSCVAHRAAVQPKLLNFFATQGTQFIACNITLHEHFHQRMNEKPCPAHAISARLQKKLFFTFTKMFHLQAVLVHNAPP